MPREYKGIQIRVLEPALRNEPPRVEGEIENDSEVEQQEQCGSAVHGRRSVLASTHSRFFRTSERECAVASNPKNRMVWEVLGRFRMTSQPGDQASLLVLEAGFTLMAGAIAFCWPEAGSRWFAKVERLFGGLGPETGGVRRGRGRGSDPATTGDSSPAADSPAFHPR